MRNATGTFENDQYVTHEDTLHAPAYAEMAWPRHMLLIDATGRAAVNRVWDRGATGETAGRLESQLTLLPKRP
jgi:hypothetical protein